MILCRLHSMMKILVFCLGYFTVQYTVYCTVYSKILSSTVRSTVSYSNKQCMINEKSRLNVVYYSTVACIISAVDTVLICCDMPYQNSTVQYSIKFLVKVPSCIMLLYDTVQ